LVLLGTQKGTIGPYLAANYRILVSLVIGKAQTHLTNVS
jgi:hypothetical protein